MMESPATPPAGPSPSLPGIAPSILDGLQWDPEPARRQALEQYMAGSAKAAQIEAPMPKARRSLVEERDPDADLIARLYPTRPWASEYRPPAPIVEALPIKKPAEVPPPIAKAEAPKAPAVSALNADKKRTEPDYSDEPVSFRITRDVNEHIAEVLFTQGGWHMTLRVKRDLNGMMSELVEDKETANFPPSGYGSKKWK